jgi:uncharacterized protein
MNKRVLKDLEKQAKKFFDNANSCHGWDHTIRVCSIAKKLCEKEKADLEIVLISAIFHDICKPEEMVLKGKICHAKEGAIKTKKILEKYGFSKEKIDKIVHCIECHRNKTSLKPISLEAKILFDADKLDALGAHGVGRLFMFASSYGAKLHDKNVNVNMVENYSEDDTAYREFLISIKGMDSKLFTNASKEIAKERIEFMENFFKQMNDEADALK